MHELLNVLARNWRRPSLEVLAPPLSRVDLLDLGQRLVLSLSENKKMRTRAFWEKAPETSSNKFRLPNVLAGSRVCFSTFV